MGGPARSWVSVICETVRFHYLFSGGGGGGNAEALHRLFQRVDVHRLGQMLVHAGLLALFHILREGICGQRLRSTLAACPHWILCGFSYKSSDIIF